MASVKSLGVHEPVGLRFAIAENILPKQPSPDLYTWEIYSDEPGQDELLTTKTCVIWSKGGEVCRWLKFDKENEEISKALFAYFPNRSGDGDAQYCAGKSAGAKPQPQPELARSLVVFLKTQAHIYSLTGGDYIVHLPFEVESAVAAPRGVVIQRKAKYDSIMSTSLKFPRAPPNSFVSSQILPTLPQTSSRSFSTAGLGKPKPWPLRPSSTLETPLNASLETGDSGWPRLVCLLDPMGDIGLVVVQPDRQSREPNSKFTATAFPDAAEEILHVESIQSCGPLSSSRGSGCDGFILAVTLNRNSCMYNVWRMSYLKNGDRLVRRKHKPYPNGTRRRSSMQHGMASGATTPHYPSFRESLGGTLPVKKTRKGEKGERVDGSIESALYLEPGKLAEASWRQSRRASSLLARADLSASHDRALFMDPPTSSTLGRRSEGTQRGRTSSGLGASLPFNQTLHSLHEAPIASLLDELRSGGDFEGFHSMALDDPEVDGLTKEILFTKIRSVPMEAANIRYSLSQAPATGLCKVFVVVGTPFSIDEQDRNYLLVCIQDTVDKRLQLLTLHVQLQRNSQSYEEEESTVTWGQLRRAQNVADSCRIQDGDQAMIAILSEDDTGGRQLSIQAPWSELTTVTLPPLSLHNRESYSTEGHDVIFQTSKPESRHVEIDELRHPRRKGVVDVTDSDGVFHQIQIQMEPRTTRVRKIINVLRSILPASHSEKIVAGWWHIMQWLSPQVSLAPADNEWLGLLTELCVIFLALLQPDSDGNTRRAQEVDDAPFLGRGIWPWALAKSWAWAMGDGIVNPSMPESAANCLGPFSLCQVMSLAQSYIGSATGSQAVGVHGYLPTASSMSESRRKCSVWGIYMALHLFVEDEKLDSMASAKTATTCVDLNALLYQVAKWLRWPSFVERYGLDLPNLSVDVPDDTTFPQLVQEPTHIPCMVEWIRSRITGQSSEMFFTLQEIYAVQVDKVDKDILSVRRDWEAILPRTSMFNRFFQKFSCNDSSVQVVERMHECGFTTPILNSLSAGIAAHFQDAISQCQQYPPSHWSKELYELVGRPDINTVLAVDSSSTHRLNTLLGTGKPSRLDSQDDADVKGTGNAQIQDEPESEERQIVIRAIFKEDKRLYEARRLLSSSKPRAVRLDPEPEWTESEYLEQQKELVTTVATSTLATPAGRGMLNYGFRFPLLTQKFHVQGFNLTCVVKPTNVAVGVDKSMFTEEKVNWAFFHQGVAYGLAISPRARGIDTSWIVFNKPGTELNHRHAGFLLALGLNGHLKSVAKWVAFKYLTPKHMMTSIGLLLGLAVSHIGTMDSLITRLLSVHVTRMLPRGAAELNLSHQVQTTGIMGIGLLYCNSQHRRMSEIMMSEIAYLGDENDEDPLRNEGYRLAAGFALGFINLGKGNSGRKGLFDMHITEQLLGLASSTKQVELVNVLDRSAPAAAIAIALIFMKTEDQIVARKVDVPDSVLQFDYVRPDVLLLRTVAKNLILWSQITPSVDWVQMNLPAEYRQRSKLDGVKSLRSVDLPLFSIIAGLCFALALRFAGSANKRARDVLICYLDRFMKIVQRFPAANFDARTARSGACMCLDTLALSCAMVMAGTGDLVVLRRLRALHGRDDPHTTYGSHFAAHLAIGTLFLGSGTTTFGNGNLAVAALLVAFYPIFPNSIQDNGSHLQAFRHFWVLATDARCLVTKDAATGHPISVPIIVRLKSSPSSPEEGVLRRQTPCLLPPLDDVAAVRTEASAQGYWDLEIDFAGNTAMIAAFKANQSLYLRRRPVFESTFASTMQALSHSGIASSIAPAVKPCANLTSGIHDPLKWIFTLNRFRNLYPIERAYVLGRPGISEDGSDRRNVSNAIDTRSSLERNLTEWDRDKLLDMRLLFDWVQHRHRLRISGKEEPLNLGSRQAQGNKDLDKGETKQSPWLNKSKTDEWWISDDAIELLKGEILAFGQSE